MSALSHVGEVQKKLLQTTALLENHIAPEAAVLGDDEATLNRDLTAARQLATSSRANIAAVQLALRTLDLQELLMHHEVMALSLRQAAARARMMPGHGLHLQAENHQKWAKALRALVGPNDAPALAEKGGA